MNNKEQTNTKPPRLLVFLLERLSDKRISYDAIGDFAENFNVLANEKGYLAALSWYIFHVVLAFSRFLSFTLYRNSSMFKNYLKVTLRNLYKHKSYSFINIGGLAAGFTCSLLILLYIQDELSYDSFHEKADRTFIVGSSYRQADGSWFSNQYTSLRTGELLKANFEQVEEVVRKTFTQSIMVKHENKRFQEDFSAFVDAGFFNVLSFELISGEKSSVLSDPNTVVITDEVANKYFGQDHPIGKIFDINDGQYQLTVSGVIKKMPLNSHLKVDFLMSMETARSLYPQSMFTNPGWGDKRVYIVLPENYSPQQFEDHLPAFIDANYDGVFTSERLRLHLIPLRDVYLKNNPDGNISKVEQIYIFVTIAFITLFIASVNYMNLATARSSLRAREVGMRKVLGARRLQLIKQFLGESVFFTTSGLILALIAVYFLLPGFNGFTVKEIRLDIFASACNMAMLFGGALLVGILSGSYPAFFLSAFRPLNVLKGAFFGKSNGTLIRKSLVVIQFGISAALIVATGTIFNQLNFLKNKELGFTKDNVIAMPTGTLSPDKLETFKSRLLASHTIAGVTISENMLLGGLNNSTPYNAEEIRNNSGAQRFMRTNRVDYEFFTLLQTEFVEGRGFSKEFSNDTKSVILNEAAVRELGWSDAVGKWFWAGAFGEGRREVIGVVKDFHFVSPKSKILPIVFGISSELANWTYIKVKENTVQDAITHIEKVHSEFITDRNFSFSFLSDRAASVYSSEEKFLQIFAVFTGLAIAIASLGILGLSSFTAERRTKEIGVRKVLGATMGGVANLLIKEFTSLIIVANIISWPVAYFFMSGWLQSFPYRIEMGAEVFVLTMLLSLLIAVVTVAFQALKAAIRNPVHSLRYE